MTSIALGRPWTIAAAAALAIAIAAAAIFGLRHYQETLRLKQEAAARVAAAVALVRSRLPEPAAPEFRELSARQHVVCGEVNFREGNTMSGYRWFVVGPGAPGGFLIDRPGSSKAEAHCATTPRLFRGKA